MKVLVLLSSVIIFCAMQPSPKIKKPASTAESSAKVGKSTKYDIAKGKELIGQSDCLTCHKEKEKIIGPAYEEVAKKYKPTEANITALANKVISGGQGVWGQIPMVPHTALSVADAKTMVAYILSLTSK